MVENSIQLRGPDLSARTVFRDESGKCNGLTSKTKWEKIWWHPNKNCSVNLIETNSCRILIRISECDSRGVQPLCQKEVPSVFIWVAQFVCVCCVWAHTPLTKAVPGEMLNPLPPHSRLPKASAPQDPVQLALNHCSCRDAGAVGQKFVTA